MIVNPESIPRIVSICSIFVGLCLFVREFNAIPVVNSIHGAAKRFIIFYSTETGNSRHISEILKALLESNNVEADIYEINCILNKDFEFCRKNVFIFVISTSGNGSFPYTSLKFVKFLKSMMKINKKIFLDVKYTVIGLGSSIYDYNFNKAAINLDRYIHRLGGIKYSEIAKLDEINGNENDLVLWWNSTFSEKIERDIGINIAKATSVNESHSGDNIICLINDCEIRNFNYKGNCHISDGYFHLSEFCIESRSILFKYRIDDIYSKYAFNLKLRLPTYLRYQTFDIIDILPANPTNTLLFFSDKILGIKDIAILENTIVSFIPKNEKLADVEVPFPSYCTLKHILTYYFDLVTLPSQDSISQFFPYLNSDEVEFITNNSYYNEFRSKYKCSFKWFIENFMKSLVPVPIEKFLLFHGMKQKFRSYSISSSSICSPKVIELTISTYIKGPIYFDNSLSFLKEEKVRYFEGLCSNYLLNVNQIEPVLGLIRTSKLELKKITVPMLLFSHGSGIAPIRALLNERKFILYRKKQTCMTHSYLFYGCKTSEQILYEDELGTLRDTGVLTDIFIALSKSENKHVRDLIYERRELVRDTLCNNDTIVFICGNRDFTSGVKSEIASILLNIHNDSKFFEKLFREDFSLFIFVFRFKFSFDMVLPLSVIKAAHHKPVLVELKNGETYSGILTGVDGFMNISLFNVICTSKGGNSFSKMIECYIRGNNIKFIRMDDENIVTAKTEMSQRESARPGSRGSNDSFDSNLQNQATRSSKSTMSTQNTLYSIFNRRNERKLEMTTQSALKNTIHLSQNTSVYQLNGSNSSPSSRIMSPNSTASVFVDMTPNGKHLLHAEVADEEPNPDTCSPNPHAFIQNRINLLASRNLLHRFVYSNENNHFGKQLSSDVITSLPDLQYNETAVQDMIINKLSMSTQMLPETIEEARKKNPEFISKALEQTLEENEQQKSIQYWSHIELNSLANELSTDLTTGLDECFANGLLESKYGPNELQKEKLEPIWKIFLSQFTSLVVSLLLIAGIVSLAFQEWVEGVGIIFIVLINASLATYMENSASNALAKLADLSSPKCTIIRSGVVNVIPASKLVPGDVILLRTGDSVPADVRLVEATEIRCNEALLTGESEDVSKHLINTDLQSPFPTNLCFASTAVTNGTGKAIVVLTGMNTQIGRIAQQLKLAQSSSSNGTPLQIGLNRLGGFIGFMSLFVLIIIVIVALLTNYKDPSHPNSNPVFSIILVAVGFAVSSIPEGLPMVVTICLSIGCSEMCRRKANIRKLPAVETLGCCSVICSDKTGTLTEGKMTAVKLATFSRKSSNFDLGNGNPTTEFTNSVTQDSNTSLFSFYPTRGNDPNGGIFLSSSLTQNIKEEILDLATFNKTKTLEIIECDEIEQGYGIKQNSKVPFKYVNYNSVCIDYGDPLNNDLPYTKCVRSTLLAGYLNSYGTVLLFDNEGKSWKTRGNMSEGALIVAAAKASFGFKKFAEMGHEEGEYIFDTSINENNSSRRHILNQQYGNMIDKAVPTEIATTGSSPDAAVVDDFHRSTENRDVSYESVENNLLCDEINQDIYCEMNYKRISSAEVPFTSSRKMMMTVHSLPIPNRFGDIIFCNETKKENKKYTDQTNPSDAQCLRYSRTVDNLDSGIFTHVAIIKGAPDRLVKHVGYMSDTVWKDEDQIIQINMSERIRPQEIKEIEDVNRLLSSEALRVLGVAILPLTSEEFLDLISEECSDKRLKLVLERNELALLGLVGSLDPPRHGVEKAITKCCEAGVRVIMITGDQQPTACAIAKSIGLLADEHVYKKSHVSKFNDLNTTSGSIVCNQLHENGDASKPHLENEEFDKIVSSVSVFCRAQPEDKIAIVRSLQRQGEVVAMTGDGVNDAPALKAADIGVSMGISGTEVAKGASEMVLLDDNFITIVNAIEEGRKIYSNVQKFVAFLLGTNIGEILYLSVAIAAQLPIPIAALQILFLNLMSDGGPAVALSVDPPNPEMMKVPPRPKKSPIMTRDWWIFANIPHAIFEAICVLAVLIISMYSSLGVFQRSSIESLCLHSSEGRYFCQTREWRLNLININKTGWVTNIDFFNPLTNRMEQVLGVVAGEANSFLSPSDITYIKEIYEKAEILGLGCVTGENGWCIPPKGTVGPDYIDLVAFGTIRGRTASFIAAVFCEMLRAYTVRTWDWFTIPLFNNPWLHFACSLSASSTLIVTFTPGLQQIFGTYTIYWWMYIIAIGAGFLNMAFDELVPKPLYRKVVERRRIRAKLLAERNLKGSESNLGDYHIAI
ncbi:P-ATPase [Cryptosporidium bovis]|uniref:P-ATPase n=1 Tax=Cryptosporidium bovis TaxID=310047 RepID=UPI00351A3CAF|nr:P-ATPase [Cryptosporidium bovis]